MICRDSLANALCRVVADTLSGRVGEMINSVVTGAISPARSLRCDLSDEGAETQSNHAILANFSAPRCHLCDGCHLPTNANLSMITVPAPRLNRCRWSVSWDTYIQLRGTKIKICLARNQLSAALTMKGNTKASPCTTLQLTVYPHRRSRAYDYSTLPTIQPLAGVDEPHTARGGACVAPFHPTALSDNQYTKRTLSPDDLGCFLIPSTVGHVKKYARKLRHKIGFVPSWPT